MEQLIEIEQRTSVKEEKRFHRWLTGVKKQQSPEFKTWRVKQRMWQASTHPRIFIPHMSAIL